VVYAPLVFLSPDVLGRGFAVLGRKPLPSLLLLLVGLVAGVLLVLCFECTLDLLCTFLLALDWFPS
jgi:hypothetical protein